MYTRVHDYTYILAWILQLNLFTWVCTIFAHEYKHTYTYIAYILAHSCKYHDICARTFLHKHRYWHVHAQPHGRTYTNTHTCAHTHRYADVRPTVLGLFSPGVEVTGRLPVSVCIHTYIHTCIYKHAHICMLDASRILSRVHSYIYTYVCTYKNMCQKAYMHKCIRTRLDAYAHTHTHAWI